MSGSVSSKRIRELLRAMSNRPAPGYFYIVHAGPGSCGTLGLKLTNIEGNTGQLTFPMFEPSTSVYHYTCVDCGYVWPMSRAEVADLMRMGMHLGRKERVV